MHKDITMGTVSREQCGKLGLVADLFRKLGLSFPERSVILQHNIHLTVSCLATNEPVEPVFEYLSVLYFILYVNKNRKQRIRLPQVIYSHRVTDICLNVPPTKPRKSVSRSLQMADAPNPAPSCPTSCLANLSHRSQTPSRCHSLTSAGNYWAYLWQVQDFTRRTSVPLLCKLFGIV